MAPVRIGDRVLAFFGDPGDNSRVDANYVLGRRFVRNSAMTTVTGNSHAAIFRRLIESDQEASYIELRETLMAEGLFAT